MGSKSRSARTRQSSAKQPVPPPPPSLAARLRHWFFRPAPLVLAALMLAGAVLLPYLPWLLPQLSDQPEYQFDLTRIEIHPPPHGWVPETLTEDVLKESSLTRKVSLLDRNLCEDVARAWSGNPWIREVKSVRITHWPAVRMEVEYRTPSVLIESRWGLYPVDRDGVLLPPTDFSVQDADRLPIARNVSTSPHSVGQPWGDRIVLYAARLAEVLAPRGDLEPYWHRYGLKAILAPQVQPDAATDAPLVFEIETTAGSRIVWGQPPGLDSLEQTAEQKLARLEYLSQQGALEAPGGPYRIDIRPFEDITLEPLGSLQYR